MPRQEPDSGQVPIQIDDILNDYYQGNHTAKEVHPLLAEHGWSGDLRGKNQVQVWGPDGKVIYHP